jgi:hypothetical protein
MSDLFASTIFVFLVYCAWAIAAYQPRHITTDAPIAESPAPETVAPPQPKTITQPMPKPAYIAPAPKAIAVPIESTTAQDLAALPIRKLYELAKARQLPRYKSLTKSALVAALS